MTWLERWAIRFLIRRGFAVHLPQSWRGDVGLRSSTLMLDRLRIAAMRANADRQVAEAVRRLQEHVARKVRGG